MRSIATDVFAMPEVTVEGEKYDCIISAVDRLSGYILAVLGKKYKKKDRKDKWSGSPSQDCRRTHG